uniref:COMM domain-containing protein n=1 Tax=Strongyloides stercoralis TaxID=6248 RepID=A0A0K0EHS4_STRER
MICHTNLRFLHSNFFQPCSLLLIKSSNYNDYPIDGNKRKLHSSGNIVSGIVISKPNKKVHDSENVTFKIETNELIESDINQFLDPMQALVDSIKEGFDLSDLCYN